MRLSLKRTGKKERSRSRQAGSRIGKYLSGCRITWKDVGITLGILFVATIAAFLYDRLTAQTMNVIMFYTLAILLVSRLTQGYVPGIAAAFLSVIAVNYLFTYPYWKLNFMLDGYPVTFCCMMVVSVLTSMAASHMKKQAKELAEREKLLAEAEKEKMRANLLRAVSHDLRTPLTGIIGASSSYLENEDRLTGEEKREMVRHIGEDADWLLNMVENLLTVTRISEGRASLNKSMEPVEEVMSEAVFRLKKRLPDANIRVILPEEFIMIPMDAMLIEQVLINLLENAVYHAESREPVECSVQTGEAGVTFFVTDQGVGIPEDKLKHIFDGTGHTENSVADGHKGMGIGLSICKTIVAAHGGVIGAENHGHGARFYFTLPGIQNGQEEGRSHGESQNSLHLFSRGKTQGAHTEL